MKRLIVLCFAIALLTTGIASAQDNMQNDTMKKDDASAKATQVTVRSAMTARRSSATVTARLGPSPTPDAIKGHEGHHVILTAHVNADKNSVWVKSLTMAK